MKKCFLLKITLTNQILAKQTLLLMLAEEQTQQHGKKLPLRAARMDLKGSVAILATCRDEKQLDRARSPRVPTQTLHNQTQFPGTYIFIGKKN